MFSLFFLQQYALSLVTSRSHDNWTIKLSSVKSLSGQYCQVCGLRYYLRVLTTVWDILSLACITGALWAKRGERGILREVQNECEAQDEGRRKNEKKQKQILLLLSHASHLFLPSPHLAHKACYRGYTFTKLCTKQFIFKELTSHWSLAPRKG